jgi:NTE family protein
MTAKDKKTNEGVEKKPHLTKKAEAQVKTKKTETSGGKKKISLALQGGGAHGAFTWGVVDRMLEDGRFDIEGLTGTSAGGMNALAVAQGLMEGGPQRAREVMREFWERISETGRHSSLNKRGMVDRMMNRYTMYSSPGFMMFDFLSRIFSPYELNPLEIDPLKDVIEATFDFPKLREYKDVKAYLCATHVYTGKLKIFPLDEIKAECLQATACLPTIHNAVKVDGEYYWDGGFIGNPVFFPLIYNCESPDIMLVQLNPMTRNHLPKTAREIADRLNEITNNASVIREMRAIHFITDLIEKGMIDESKIKRVFMHLIEDEETFTELGWSSKLNTEWEFLTHLFEKGRNAADRWIKENYEHVGVKTTAPMEDHFVGNIEDYSNLKIK